MKVKKSVDKKAEEEALKRAAERSKRLNKDKRNAEAAAVTGPSIDQKAFEDQQNELTPEQIDALKRKLEEKNRAMIKKLTSIIERDPYSEQKPEMMFQKAELLWELRNWEYLRERAKYNQCLDAAGKGTVDDKSCKEPTPDYKEAQEIYKEILQQYPAYERLDEVIYRLGRGLIDAGKGAEAVSFLQRLVKNYPNSKYLPDAQLALGEFFFEKELLGAARDSYTAVLGYNDPRLQDYAMYKLGWVLFNQSEFRESVNTFKKVVESSEKRVGFQNQAINDLVIVFAEIDGGWKEARDYLLAKKGEDFMYNKLGQMAGLLEAQGKDDSAVEIYEWFVEKRPNDPKVPQWAESIIIAKKKEVNDLEGLEKQMNRFVAYFAENGTWWTKNKADEPAINNANLLVDASLAYLSNFFHRRAQEKGDVGDYQKAADYYTQYIKKFPNTSAAFDMNFFLAEILLLNLNQPERAAEQYQKVVELYRDNKIPEGVKKEDAESMAKDSAYAVVTAYNELVKTNHPDSILVEMAKYDESKRAKQATNQRAESVDTPPIPTTPLLKYELKFVEASDQFANMFPKEEVTPTVDFVAAEVYKSRGHYDKAVPRYESIIQNAPKHRYASFAGNSLLEANYRLKRWDEVEKWARHLLDNKIFDVTPKEKLQSAIAYAINQRAIDLKNNKEFDKAAKELLRLADEFPESELAPGALFNAAAIYEAGDQTKEALATYTRVIEKYPKNLNAPQAIFVMGAIYESRADFANAAEYFARLGSNAKYVNEEGTEVEYKDHPNAPDAVYNSGVLLEAMEKWDDSIAAYEKYMKVYPNRENVRDVALHLAYLEREKKDWKAAKTRFEDFLKRKDVKETEKVEIYDQVGLLVGELKDKNWEKTQDEYFTKSVETWKKLTDEADKRKTSYYAAEARFLQAEKIYFEFAKVKLGFPMSALQKALLKKGELEQAAEGIYTEVIAMESPRWVAASAFRVGQMYKNFSDELYNLPMPEGLTPDQEDEYRAALDDNAFPLQEKALTAYRSALKLALQYQAYNEWSAKSAEAISKLESEAYPITGQDGVEVEHQKLKFFIPAPVTDLKVVKERVKARKEAQKAAEPAPVQATTPQASK
ncbi:MAG: tetratricopeptide repeat protein [bacterium]